jgi:hypothetical protein
MPGWSLATWQARRTCGKAYPGRGLMIPTFPKAIPAAFLTARCDNCGGPWRVVSDGVACLVCPRHVHVVEALQALMASGAVRAHTERPMGVRLAVGGGKRSAG